MVGIFFVLQALFGFPIFKPKSDIVDSSAVVEQQIRISVSVNE
jgi:hypothetical protein